VRLQPARSGAALIAIENVFNSRAAATRAPGGGFVPVADYHQHLLSPAGAARQNRFLPAVALPEDLARLIEE
jgi:hypothetical protein